MNHRSLQSLGYAQLTNVAIPTLISSALANGIPNGTERVTIQPTGQNVRYRDDGQAPTNNTGMRLRADRIYEFDVANIASMNVVEEVTGADLNITFYGTRA